MSRALLKEFKPSILFLAKFLGAYLLLNLLYGLYINSYSPDPDPVTYIVTEQTSWILNLVGNETTILRNETQPNVYLSNADRDVLSVFEGCNGLNTMIVFVSFLIAYGQLKKKLLWFIPLGIIVIHLFNLVRVGALYYITVYFDQYLYFTHKYLFTGFLFGIIFIMWYIWVTRLYNKSSAQ
ncbi:exosortase family protein XrtF [Fulvivirga lutimaris]|uniref:exosortase family protein XrtF n=1 Tax=Fulvivirga lutimaris TaxID=1819566 RepID=UPI0012BD2C66|nr:exosortase family protein XrtF [Fulvivirga lutimaris]MTI38857.1 exosortase family protein XrtF [Fulvivirga lutimaris]